MTTDHILEVKNVAKSYGRKKVLNNVCFSMDRGKIIGIEGENGAGKSTLLKILVGMLAPDRGWIKIYGSIGFCPQEMLIFETLTVSENFYYFSGAYGLPPNGIWRQQMKNLLKRFNFQNYQNIQVSKLSGGTKQKLNLALALLHSPDILILDEPYAAFDWETYLHFWEYVQELRELGKNVLIVSHLIYDPTMIDKRYRLENGELQCI
jgi:ABC-2 type transport system ATP-binding protein